MSDEPQLGPEPADGRNPGAQAPSTAARVVAGCLTAGFGLGLAVVGICMIAFGFDPYPANARGTALFIIAGCVALVIGLVLLFFGANQLPGRNRGQAPIHKR